MKEDIENSLCKTGLSKNEAIIYLTLFKTGLTSSKLIIKNTNLHRQIVYDSLNSLIEKGIVSYIIQSNRKYFKASDPAGFQEYFNEKENEIENQREEFNKILKQLEAVKGSITEEQEATIYSGNKGIKSLLDDMANQSEEILLIGASEQKSDSFLYHLKFNIPKFHSVREKNKIPVKILLGKNLKERALMLKKLKYTQAKVLPDEFTSNSSTNIYGDKMSIIMWGAQPFGILIKSKEIAESQRKRFNLLWNMAKEP